MNRGIVYIISAPSGTGKTTLCNKAVEYFTNLRHSISYTTREPRDGERDGTEYHFVGDDRFEAMVKADEFVEYALVHGNRYGTSASELERLVSEGKDIMVEIDVQGAEKLMAKMPDAASIFILPPTEEACEARLRARGKDDDETIKRRIKDMYREVAYAEKYDYLIINDDLDTAFEGLKSVLITERIRTKRMISEVRKRFS